MSDIPREDWGPGGESRGVAVVPATPAYRTAEEVPPGTALTGYEVAALATKDVSGEPAGLPGELIREMQRAADGYDRNYDMLQDSANRVLSEVKDPAAFSASFDGLSPGIRSKALRTLWRNPGIGLADLVDKVETTLTLAEAHEAGVWVRKWAGCLR
jgi:hypothetical protein